LKPEADLSAVYTKVKALFAADQANRLLYTGNFQIGEFQGFSAALTDNMLRSIRANPNVLYVEANQVVNISQSACIQERTTLWNLDRVSERALDLAGRYFYVDSAGQGTTAYIVDTGIYTDNVEFEGRASWGFAIDNRLIDGNGHGTHVASTVMGRLYGLAKKATAVAVKVLGTDGSGTTAGVIAGVNWVAQNARKPAVANMSLGGGLSTALNQAVTSAVGTGIPFAVAAGNSNQDACSFSPASATNALCVGATDSGDRRSSFSNWGSCVKIFAPGTAITGAWIGGTTAVRTISGTSMASPHVAGAVALIQGVQPTLTPAQIQTALIAAATRNVITDVRNSPNLMLYSRNCN